MKYVSSFQPGFNPDSGRGDIVVYFSDNTILIHKDLSADTFNALINILEQKNISYNKKYYFCGYPHNAIEMLKKANKIMEWE